MRGFEQKQLDEKLQQALKTQGISFETGEGVAYGEHKDIVLNYQTFINIAESAFADYKKYIKYNITVWTKLKNDINAEVEGLGRRIFAKKYDLKTHQNYIDQVNKQLEQGAINLATQALGIVNNSLPEKSTMEQKNKIRKAITFAVIDRFRMEFSSFFGTELDKYLTYTTVNYKEKEKIANLMLTDTASLQKPFLESVLLKQGAAVKNVKTVVKAAKDLDKAQIAQEFLKKTQSLINEFEQINKGVNSKLTKLQSDDIEISYVAMALGEISKNFTKARSLLDQKSEKSQAIEKFYLNYIDILKEEISIFNKQKKRFIAELAKAESVKKMTIESIDQRLNNKVESLKADEQTLDAQIKKIESLYDIGKNKLHEDVKIWDELDTGKGILKKYNDNYAKMIAHVDKLLPKLESLDKGDNRQALITKDGIARTTYIQLEELEKGCSDPLVKAKLEDAIKQSREIFTKTEEEIIKRRENVKITFVDKAKGQEWRQITYRKLKSMYDEKHDEKSNVSSEDFQQTAFAVITKGMACTKPGEKIIKAKLEDFYNSMKEKNQNKLNSSVEGIYQTIINAFKSIPEQLGRYFKSLEAVRQIRKETVRSRKFTDKIKPRAITSSAQKK